ncbi:MAG: hypothetical protein PHP32_01720 [Candidatus Izemoplasmatales bacterium]|nr:hypothetical protein [Candidatus Izemoplasmatales bacterium]
MKNKLNRMMDWFEDHFNTVIDVIALVGASFMILFSLVLFVLLLLNQESVLNIFDVIIPPGAIGFFGILMLFALRITRHITKK